MGKTINEYKILVSKPERIRRRIENDIKMAVKRM